MDEEKITILEPAERQGAQEIPPAVKTISETKKNMPRGPVGQWVS